VNARPIRVRALVQGIASWQIVTLATFATLEAAISRARRRVLTSELLWIERAGAPASIDRVMYVNRTERPF